ncbi:hypothetical protein NLG97_g11117 [Lecanicillium saksenae]|uniref:Uncharacterized protein n=1 Tax=Lecanicillium saksenae TaxID=468837 RepID=A0ACC1QBF7_9HYPO|nr:hypothetical protein NLG97_g11117 [Lecanicillium saksenae]
MATPTATGTASVASPTTPTTAFDGQSTTTSRTPMTTAFSMPSGCPDFNGAYLESWINGPPDVPANIVFRLQLSEAFRPSCWPSQEFHATYSPGVCPAGWTYYSIIPATTDSTTTMFTPSASDATPYPVVFQDADQMTAYCCPRCVRRSSHAFEKRFV